MGSPTQRRGKKKTHTAHNAAAPMEFSFCTAFYDVVTLNVATKFVTTRDGAMSSMENFALVSALLLTMVTLTNQNELGDKLQVFDEEFSFAIYTALSFFALSGFFLATVCSASILIFMSFLCNDAELVAYVSQCGYLFKMSLGMFFFAFFSYISATLLQLASLLGESTGIAFSAP